MNRFHFPLILPNAVPEATIWLVCCSYAMQEIRAQAELDPDGLCKFRLDAGWIEDVPIETLAANIAQRLSEKWTQVRVVVPHLVDGYADAVFVHRPTQQALRLCCYEYHFDSVKVLDALMVPDLAISTYWRLNAQPRNLTLASMDTALCQRHQAAFHRYWAIAEDMYGADAFGFPLPQGQTVSAPFLPSYSAPTHAANDEAPYSLAALAGADTAAVCQQAWHCPLNVAPELADLIKVKVERTTGGLHIDLEVRLLRHRWDRVAPAQVQIFMDGHKPLVLPLTPVAEQTGSHLEYWYAGEQKEISEAFCSPGLNAARAQIVATPAPLADEETA